MDRVDDLDVASIGEAQQGVRHPLQAAVEILAPMPGDQDQALARRERRQQPLDGGGTPRVAIEDRQRVEQRVDHRVAGDAYPRRIDAFGQQVATRFLGRRKVQVGEPGGQPAVHLLRPRRMDVARPQARLDMADRHLRVERGQRGGEGRGRVALHEHPIRTQIGIDLGDALQHRGRDVSKALTRAHQIEVAIGADGEQVEHLVQHLAVLRGHADQGGDAGRFGEPAHDGRHLDRLGAGAEDRQDAHASHPAAGTARATRANPVRRKRGLTGNRRTCWLKAILSVGRVVER